MQSQTVFIALRDALAGLYPAKQDARVIVDDAWLERYVHYLQYAFPDELAQYPKVGEIFLGSTGIQGVDIVGAVTNCTVHR